MQVVAWDGERPVGKAMVLFPSHEEWSVSAEREGCAEIRDVGVVEDHRRRGVATAMISSLESAAAGARDDSDRPLGRALRR